MKELEPTDSFLIQQAQLSNELARVSEATSIFFGGGNESVWHVINPKFEKPNIELKGRDVSSHLEDLARSTSDFQVHYSFHEETDFGDEKEPYILPECHIWEIFPPKGTSAFIDVDSQCTRRANIQGLGMALYCPATNRGINPDEISKLKEDGTLNVDFLIWQKNLEGYLYDNEKPESIFLNLLKEDPIASLQTALWILKSLAVAEEIHPEFVSYKTGF